MISRFSIILFILTFLLTSAEAQTRRAQKLEQQVWGPDARGMDILDAPEKWADASAVILYQEIIYDFDQQGTYFKVNSLLRQRLKLQDRLAVEDFSELSFSPGDLVGVKIIKPDGTTHTLDMSKAIVAEGDMGSLRKIPLEDLSPGDILDFYSITTDTRPPTADRFDPIITILSEIYPILEQRLVFLADRRFHFKFRSLNGAPEIKKLAGSGREIAFELIDRNREAEKEERWYEAYREEPTLKMKMLYLKSNNSAETRITDLYDKGEISTSLPQDLVLQLAENFHQREGFDNELKTFLEDTLFEDKREELEFAYEYFRHKLIVKEIEDIRANGSIISSIPEFGLLMIDFSFINKFSAYLLDREIPFEIILAMPKSLGVIDDLLMSDELVGMLKVDLGNGESLFLSRPGLHTIPGDIPSIVEGTKAYIMIPDKRGRPESIRTTNLPLSTYQDNSMYSLAEADLDQDMRTVRVKMKSELKGYNKEVYQSAFLPLHKFAEQDKERFHHIYKSGFTGEASKELMRRKANALEKYKKEDTEAQKEIVDLWTRDNFEFNIDTVDHYEINHMGRRVGEEIMTIDQNFITTSIVSRAGKNYIIDLGKLIGGQIALEEDERERRSDIYMPFARGFINEIHFKIPAGYTISGLDKFSIRVVNDTGGFTSTAEIRDQTIILKTDKYYARHFSPAEAWPEIETFLDAAFQLTQQKILLKPIED